MNLLNSQLQFIFAVHTSVSMFAFHFQVFHQPAASIIRRMGRTQTQAFPSHMNARLRVAQSRLQLLPWLRQLLGPPLLLLSAGLQTLVISSPPPMMTSARDDPQL